MINPNLLTRESIEGLDLVISAEIHPITIGEIRKILMKGQGGQCKGEISKERFSELSYFALDLGKVFSKNEMSDEFISPYLSQTVPVKIYNKSLIGNRFLGRNSNTMSFLQGKDIFENSISISDNQIYYGQHEYGTALVLEELIEFDSKKEFMFVRSPNNSQNFDNIIYKGKLSESLMLGNWIITKEDGDDKLHEFDFASSNPRLKPLTDKYFLNQFHRAIQISERDGETVLRYSLVGEKPEFEKTETGYQSIPGGDPLQIRYFKVFDIKKLSDFDPLTFNPDNNSLKEIKNIRSRKYDSELDKKEFSLIYENPEELISRKSWAYNAMRGMGISKYDNSHLFN